MQQDRYLSRAIGRMKEKVKYVGVIKAKIV